MFLIFSFIILAIIIAALFSYFDSTSSGRISFTVVCVISLVACIATWSASYESYLNMRGFFKGTCEQYVGAVKVYGNWAILDIESAAWTDFKYQGYQENTASFIKTLRNKVIWYNNLLVKKETMKSNPIFSWLIIAPDKDMVLIRMSDKIHEDIQKDLEKALKGVE